MIVYQEIWKRLADHGWTAYRLVKEKEMGNGTIARLRSGESVSTDTLDTLCRLCDCQPGDLIRYEPGERERR